LVAEAVDALDDVSQLVEMVGRVDPTAAGVAAGQWINATAESRRDPLDPTCSSLAQSTPTGSRTWYTGSSPRLLKKQSQPQRVRYEQAIHERLLARA
jgi:hypothetical protein